MAAFDSEVPAELTEIEVKALDYLDRTLRPGFCPSREEISRALGLGARGYHVTRLLSSLLDKGYISLLPGRSRAIRLLKRADGRPVQPGAVWVPLVGQVVAGAPAPSFGQQDNPFAGEAIELTRSLVGSQDGLFALRIAGDSMIDALVHDGDVVVLRETHTACNGDMVAAAVTEEDGQEATTLKHFHRERGRVRLQPANPAMQPFIYAPERVRVIGKVVLVVRRVS
jgi:repressor LexA